VVAIAIALVTSAVLSSCGASQPSTVKSNTHRGAVTLAVVSQVRTGITIAFEHHADVLPGDAELVLHGLHLARSLATGALWAVAEFRPTKQAFAEEQSMGPPFADGVLPNRPDPVVAITGGAMTLIGGAVTLVQPEGHPWSVIARGGVDWPCQGVLPSSVWAAWHVEPSVLCRAERAVPLRVSLPNGSYFGYITAVETRTGGKGTIIFDPETISSSGLAVVDLYPYTYRLGVGASTTVEVSEGFNAAAAHTYDEPWSDFVHYLTVTNTPNAPTSTPWQYAIAVTSGRATFIKQFSNVTPYCAPFGGTDEPTSPSDRSPVTIPSHC
jgi:hypothetical protein